MAKAAATEKLPNIPKGDWPGAWKLYKYAKQAVLRNWQVILWLTLLSAVLSIFIDGLFGDKENQFFPSLLAQLVAYAASLILTIVYFVSVRGRKISFSDAVKQFDPLTYVKYIGATIVAGVLSGLSLLLLIVPFFFVFPRLMMAPYLAVDKKLNPIDATTESWNMTKGYLGAVWGIIGATLAMTLLILTIIGIPFAIYFLFMYQVAMVILYEYLLKNKKRS